MGIFDRFPYSSTHEMNLDFMLGKATEIAESLQEVQDGLSDIDTHKAQAEQAAQDAAQAKQAAQSAAQTASTSAGQAAQHKTDAEDAADRAEAASNLADDAVEQAQTAAQNASTAADGAIASATAAENRINAAAAQAQTDVQAAATQAQTNVQTAADSAVASAAAAENRINALAESLPEDFTELNNEVTDLRSAFDKTNKIAELTIKNITGNEPVIKWNYKYYYPTGSSATNVNVNNPTGSPELKCAFVACNPGDIFYYTGKGRSPARSWAFLKENGDIISKASIDEYTNYKITAPDLSAYVVFNCEINHDVCVYKNTPLTAVVESIGSNVEELEQNADITNAAINQISNKTQVTKAGELFQPGIMKITGLESDATSMIIRNAQMYEQKYPGTNELNGVSFTNNGDGSYTINGTSTSSTWFFINQSTRTGSDNRLSLHGTYSIGIETLAGKASALSVALRQYPEDENSLVATLAEPNVFGNVDSDHIVIGVYVGSGNIYTNYKFRVMVNKGSEVLPYTNYMTPTIINDMGNLIETANQYLPNIWLIATPQTASISGSFTVIEKTASNKITAKSVIISANHRGYHAGYPENTLWAFAQSKIRGFNWIENDVRFTSDGVGVLLHDESINRTARNADGTEITGTVNIADITYEQACGYDFGIYAGDQFAGTKIVTVEECVSFCKSVGLGILMEPKVNGSGAYCANIVKAYAMENNVIWISFGLTPLQEVNAVLPEAKVGLVTTSEPSSTHVTSAIGLKTEQNKVFLDFNYTYPIASIKESMIANNIGYGVYTLDTPSALATLDPYCFMITSNTLLADQKIAEDAMKNWTL